MLGFLSISIDRNKYIVVTLTLIVFFSLSYFLLLERNWVKGVTLNPLQIDEIELIREDEPLYSRQGIRIHDKQFIRQILRDIQGAKFNQETLLLDERYIKGERYLLLARDGETIKLHAEIYSGSKKSFNEEAVMIIADRYYYEIPNSIKQLFMLKPKEIAQELKKADMWIHWNPFVVIDGQPFYQYYAGEKFDKSLFEFEEEFVIKKTLPSLTKATISQDPTAELVDGIASIGPKGTVIYKSKGIYFSNYPQNSDNWSVLLPYGQRAHSLDVETEEEVEYWNTYDISYFIVRSQSDILVLSSEDPLSPEGSLLRWDKGEKQFVSNGGSVTYSKTGEPSKEGYAPMQIFPSKVWNNILFFSCY